jgi:methionyl-tRNA synthetase
MGIPYYVTTPIFYVNDEPHLGHAYTTILGDVLSRFARLRGEDAFFLTGTDEHGQKVERAAKALGIHTQAYVYEMAQRFRNQWDIMHVAYDDFIRTSEARHEKVVQHVLQQLWKNGEIYKAKYSGWYCVPDERFWTEKDIVDGACPDCGRVVEQLEEENYFFRMSKYHAWLVEHVENHPNFILPESRKNEVLGFLEKPLGDLCISRPKARMSWGISLPFDEAYVTYVWFDALLNYVTACGYLVNEHRFRKFWPVATHLIGKDILITHAVYWPSILKAAGIAPPKSILAHGWWVSHGTKLSKSRGNAVRPADLASTYGVDALRYLLIRDMTLGRDADFDEDRLLQRYQADLANNLGNLLHRIINMIGRYCDGRVPLVSEPEATLSTSLRESSEPMALEVLAQVENYELNTCLSMVMGYVGSVNKYLESASPWKLAKTGRRAEVNHVLYTASEALRFASVLLWPIMPNEMTRWVNSGAGWGGSPHLC